MCCNSWNSVRPTCRQSPTDAPSDRVPQKRVDLAISRTEQCNCGSDQENATDLVTSSRCLFHVARDGRKIHLPAIAPPKWSSIGPSDQSRAYHKGASSSRSCASAILLHGRSAMVPFCAAQSATAARVFTRITC